MQYNMMEARPASTVIVTSLTPLNRSRVPNTAHTPGYTSLRTMYMHCGARRSGIPMEARPVDVDYTNALPGNPSVA